MSVYLWGCKRGVIVFLCVYVGVRWGWGGGGGHVVVFCWEAYDSTSCIYNLIWPKTFLHPSYDIIVAYVLIANIQGDWGYGRTYIHASTITHTLPFNPCNSEVTFIQITRTQRSLETLQTLSWWYSSKSSCSVLSDEYPFARVSIIFQDFQDFRIILYLLN